MSYELLFVDILFFSFVSVLLFRFFHSRQDDEDRRASANRYEAGLWGLYREEKTDK